MKLTGTNANVYIEGDEKPVRVTKWEIRATSPVDGELWTQPKIVFSERKAIRMLQIRDGVESESLSLEMVVNAGGSLEAVQRGDW